VAFNFRLNVQQVFRRLGIQTGARLPQLEDNIQMVLLVSDLSKLVPAPIEARGMCGANIGAVGGTRSTVQLQSLSQGGIFIESITFRATTLLNSENYLMDVTLTNLGLAGLPGNVNIGGTPIFSRFTGGNPAVSTAGASIPAASEGGSIFIQPGIFVPNQAFLSITTSANNERLDVAMFYRELPAVEEVG